MSAIRFRDLLSLSPARGVPRAFWTILRPYRVIACAGFVLLVSASCVAVVGLFWDFDRTANFLVPFGFLALILGNFGLRGAMTILLRQQCRRMEALLRQEDQQVCAQCGYLLRGSIDLPRCPECGVDYDLRSLKEMWTEWTGRSP